MILYCITIHPNVSWHSTVSRYSKVSRYLSRLSSQVPASTCTPYQVNCDGCTQQPPAVDVHRMVPELDDPGEASQDGQHDEGEHQKRLEQLGRVCQHCVEVHLEHTVWEEPLVIKEQRRKSARQLDVFKVIYCSVFTAFTVPVFSHNNSLNCEQLNSSKIRRLLFSSCA